MWPYAPTPPPPPPPRDPQPIMEAAAKPESGPPDLDSQYEDLLDAVWDSERRERMNDRIDAALALELERERAAQRRRSKKKP